MPLTETSPHHSIQCLFEGISCREVLLINKSQTSTSRGRNMKILDAHSHMGECRVFNLDVTEEDLIRNMDANGMDTAIVQPFPGADPQPLVDIHDRMAKLAEKHPSRVFGMVNVNPYLPEEAWKKEMNRCIKDLRFVGVRLHTLGQAILPTSVAGMMILKCSSIAEKTRHRAYRTLTISCMSSRETAHSRSECSERSASFPT